MVSLGDITSAAHELIADSDQEKSRHVCMEVAQGPSVIRWLQGAFSVPPGQRRPNLDISHLARSNNLGILDTLPSLPCSILIHIQFYHGACVEVQNHRRSSMIVSATDGPLINRAGLAAPWGLPPAQCASPARSMASSLLARGDVTAGTIRATGCPLSVIVIRSPRPTRLMYWLRRDFNSRIPTLAMPGLLHVTTR